jgi:hypothetical protein
VGSKFEGYPKYLDAAALDIGHPEAAIPARRIATLSAIGILCAQAVSGRPEHLPGILAKAEEFRNQLHAAYRAAQLMIEDIGGRSELLVVSNQGDSKSATTDDDMSRLGPANPKNTTPRH